MSILWRLVKLFFGLIYRLIVLALFERWIPFEKAQPQTKAARQKQPKKPKQPKQPKQRNAARTPPPPPRAAYQQPRPYQESAFFENRSIEPSADQVSMMEGQHMRVARRVPRPPAPKRRQSIAAMARDKSAVRDALVLGAVFSPPRSRRY